MEGSDERSSMITWVEGIHWVSSPTIHLVAPAGRSLKRGYFP